VRLGDPAGKYHELSMGVQEFFRTRGFLVYSFAQVFINEFIDILIHPYRKFTARINLNGAPEKPATVALFVA
jgi:hypothetical protein